jgi:protein TonB
VTGLLAVLLHVAGSLQSAEAPAAVADAPIVASSRLRGREISRFFSRDDYPAAALRAEQEGVVGFRLAIGANGRIAACTITSSSGSSALDRATCRILTSRIAYAPARDPRAGRAATEDEGTIRWRLPADRPRTPNIGTTYRD